LLHDSRRNARVIDGSLVTLEEQDRSLWDRAQIDEGLALIEKALRMGCVGPNQLQAAIAAVHAQAGRAVDTDWAQIAALYRTLVEMNPSPVIALNHAAAIAMSEGLEEGLRRIDELESALDRYYLFHAARADLLRRLNRTGEAAAAYEKALTLTTNQIERNFLTRRRYELS
jgi:RNA polymerase sigma-70 factor, ECF subfamily